MATPGDEDAEIVLVGHGIAAMVDAGRRTVLDPSAAKNAADFFAVVTELYFTNPRRLADKLPELYDIVRDFYRIEIAER